MTTLNKKILIIEDEKPLAKVIAHALTHAGFETDIAFDGEAGFKFINGGKYDLILLDLAMPKMNGFIFLEKIKENNIATPIMVLTNLNQDSDIKRTKALGVKDFFVKSDTPMSVIVEKVNKLLNK